MKRILLFLLFIVSTLYSYAQLWDKMCTDDYQVDSMSVGALKAEINALAFFQNDEYSSKVMKGYTLPGTWLQPKLTYSPTIHTKIEVGAHLLLFNGANRYPNQAYHDIAMWKGGQYQHGVHALPYFRAQAQIKNLTFVLGDLFGAQNHQLILPLFNPEQNLSTDPEMGFQMLLDRKHVHFDTWINWQSYIFDFDNHQEAFTVGVNSTLKWNKDRTKVLQWETPIQLLIQHRGGEQDITTLGVQTLCNASVGMRVAYKPSNKKIKSTQAEINGLVSYQQHGNYWPFDLGYAIHCGVQTLFRNNLGVELGYVGIPKQYANLYGSPFFGTLSIKHDGLVFDNMHTAYANINYTYSFTPAYKLGAQIDLYSANSKGMNSFCFGFGVYFRVNPSFVITRKK